MSDKPNLPGDLTATDMVERIIRIDHAGGYGASQIFAGQLAVLGHGEKADTIRHMKAQEDVRLRAAANLIGERRVRPTALLPLWNIAGFALGAVTAAMGSRAAMACTAAVERAIDEHHQAQAERLGNDEGALKATIVRSPANEAGSPSSYRLMSRVIKAGCKVAITVSERV